jgi:hypothetical protein
VELKGDDSRSPWSDTAEYPDLGCNYEIFTNSMLTELENLGALQTLEPGATATHIETEVV